MRLTLGLLVATLAFGTWLRFVLAGELPTFGVDFRHARHAHSHLGYFAALVPLAWRRFEAEGARGFSPRWRAVYLVAALVAVAGFLRAGYGPEAIAGSTVVGAMWLVHAGRNASALRSLTSWRASHLPALLLASACVPMIALLTRRDPATAQQWVQTYLTLLLLGSLYPAALARDRAPVVAWPLWVAASAVAALDLGVGRTGATGLGTLFLGALLGWSGLQSRAPVEVRALYGLLALGLLGTGSRLVDNAPDVAIAGLHLAILGPFLSGFLTGQVLRRAWALTTVFMVTALLLPRLWPAAGGASQLGAACAGVVLVVLGVYGAVGRRAEAG